MRLLVTILLFLLSFTIFSQTYKGTNSSNTELNEIIQPQKKTDKIGERLFITTSSEVQKIDKTEKILLYIVDLDDESDMHSNRRQKLITNIKRKTKMNVIDWRELFPVWVNFELTQVDSILSSNKISKVIQIDTSNIVYGEYTTPVQTITNPTGYYDANGVYKQIGENSVTSGGKTYKTISSMDLKLSIFDIGNLDIPTHEIIYYKINDYYNDNTIKYIYTCMKNNNIIN